MSEWIDQSTEKYKQIASHTFNWTLTKNLLELMKNHVLEMFGHLCHLVTCKGIISAVNFVNKGTLRRKGGKKAYIVATLKTEWHLWKKKK